ncbi:MAG: SdpI family protein [Agathobaculum sp.]|jgi:uncharacterized membrane protein|uniref:SdpI family protein n=1 Tax=Agathobaculum sp. TaxID=2048138 RepID=UPI003D930143
MKKVTKMQIFAWVLAVLPLVLVAAVYSRLPAEIPMQWDFGGQVRYGAKWQIWGVAGLAPVMAVLFSVLPVVDPKKRNYRKFRVSYDLFQVLMMLFLLAMVGICVTEALWPDTVNVSMAVCLLCSLLFVFLGNVMPKFRPNFYCGIKNPWTLSSETVWTRTHRLGGRMMFAAGLIGLAGAFVPNNYARFALLFVPVMAACIVPSVKSYFWYRAESKG